MSNPIVEARKAVLAAAMKHDYEARIHAEIANAGADNPESVMVRIAEQHFHESYEALRAACEALADISPEDVYDPEKANPAPNQSAPTEPARAPAPGATEI